MKLLDFKLFAPFILTTTLLSLLLTEHIATRNYKKYRYLVRVPTEFKSNLTNLTDEQLLNFLRTGEPSPIPDTTRPNFPFLHNCGTLLVSLSTQSKIKFNMQDVGFIENVIPLSKKLSEIFREREEAGVFEDNSDKIVKAVIIKAPRSAKYGDVAKLIDAVKSSGADPIILQIDDLPE